MPAVGLEPTRGRKNPVKSRVSEIELAKVGKKVGKRVKKEDCTSVKIYYFCIKAPKFSYTI